MRTLVSLRSTYLVLIAILCSIFVSGSNLYAADDILNLTFRTTDAGGNYGTEHVHSVWLEDTSGNFVTTVGNGSGATRALWGNTRAHDIISWWNINPDRPGDIDARTAATQTVYKLYNIAWNLTKRDGSVIPDGDYVIKFETTNDNEDKNFFNRAGFNFSKNGVYSSITPADQGGYRDLAIEYVPDVVQGPTPPTVSNAAASNVSFATATLNGTVTDTGGEDPTVSIYWGLTDGATTPTNWDYVTDMATQAGAFSTNITGLAEGTTYYFRSYAQNSAGESWAGSSASFTTLVQNPAEIAVTPALLDFGTVSIGSATEMTFDIENHGGTDLNVHSLSVTGLDKSAYSLVAAPQMPSTIPQGRKQTITVSFTALGALTYNNAQVTIGNNDPNQAVISVALTGQGDATTQETLEVSSNAGGNSNAVAVNASNIFLGQGATLSVLNADDPANPQRVSQVRTAGAIKDLAVSADMVYAAAGSYGVLAVDITDLSTLVATVVEDTTGHVYDVDAEGAILCAADGDAGVKVYDITSPQSPLLAGTYQTQGSARAVAVSGNTAYVLDEQLGLQMIDLTTPSSPALAGTFNEIEFGESIAIANQKAYISDRSGHLFVVDIATSSPSLDGKITLTQGYGISIAVSSSYAYVTIGNGGIEIINISTPSAMTSDGVYDTPGNALDVLVANNVTYVADESSGLRILNASNPASVVELGSYTTQSNPYGVAANNSVVYSAEGNTGIQSLNVSSDAVVAISKLDTIGDAQAIAISGTTAFVANGLGGLQIVDVSSNPPTMLGKYQTTGFAANVAVQGSTAVVTDGRNVHVINVSDTSAPTANDVWASGGFLAGVDIDGNYAYIADSGYGLWIIDLSNPSNIVEAGSFDTAGMAYGVAVANGVAYVADGVKGLQIIDVSTPSSPSLIATFDTAGLARDVEVTNNLAYVADSLAGVTVVDVTTPSAPTLYAQTSAPLNAVSLTINNSQLIVADRLGGLITMGVRSTPGALGTDINADGAVNLLDYAIILAHWLEENTALKNWADGADINTDGTVNMEDLYLFTNDYLGGVVQGPTPDVVSITLAQYDAAAQELTVEATSSSDPPATLTLEGYGQMTFEAEDNEYEYSIKPIDDPGSWVTVTSDSGASDTRSIEHTGTDPGTSEVLQITRVEYKIKDSELRVEATSTEQPTSELTVQGYENMNWVADKAQYEYRQKNVSDPAGTVNISSASGATDSRYVVYNGSTEDINITKVQYKIDDQELIIEVNTANQPNETVTVQGYGTMTWNAEKNKYEYIIKPVALPDEAITITASSSGSAFRTVELK